MEKQLTLKRSLWAIVVFIISSVGSYYIGKLLDNLSIKLGTMKITFENFWLIISIIGLILLLCILAYWAIKDYDKKAKILNIINQEWVKIYANNPNPSGYDEKGHEGRLVKDMINDLSNSKLHGISKKDIEKYVNKCLGNTNKTHDEPNNAK